jgi:hypothetical protein
MLRKILIIFVIPILLYSCGYSPLYSNISDKNINIEVLQTKGDQEINNHLLSNFKKYAGKQGKTYLLDINTYYSILDNSKNLEGSISNYQLIATTTFQVKSENFVKTITIQEDIIIKNLGDNFEKRNYEKSIKRNFGNSIANKLILQISSIQ